MKLLRWLGLPVGMALFAWILRSADLAAVWEQVRNLHWRFGVIFLFYILTFGLDTLGWKFALSTQAQTKVRWDRLFRARLAGEAVNYVTPTAWIGGEPVKAYLLSKRYGVPMSDGMASVVIAKTTFSLSMLLFILVGLGVAGFSGQIPPSISTWVWVTLPVFSVLMFLFVLVQFLQPFRRTAVVIRKFLPGWIRSLEEKIHEWDSSIVHFYRQNPQALFYSLGFHFLGWMCGVVEVFLILHFLGIPVGWATAWSIEALWLLLKAGAFLIPASLGASEGFLLLICVGLGVNTVSGLALALIRRAREMVWMGLGLVEFSRG